MLSISFQQADETKFETDSTVSCELYGFDTKKKLNRQKSSLELSNFINGKV